MTEACTERYRAWNDPATVGTDSASLPAPNVSGSFLVPCLVSTAGSRPSRAGEESSPASGNLSG
jgi:hypothetical protein